MTHQGSDDLVGLALVEVGVELHRTRLEDEHAQGD
jgi:hypothetical protein